MTQSRARPEQASSTAWATPYLARCSFPPAGAHVTCAVSGGADSLALLALSVAAGCVTTAVHVDHGLRAGSAAEAEVVRAAARQVGAAFVATRVDVAPGPNLEARARAARYGVLPAGVLTGHTADDQAETVMLNILRGAGLSGLGGIAPSTRRPLLGLRRQETAAICSLLGWRPVHDASNDDRAFRRNRVRHDVLPLLADVADRDPVPLLVRLAQLARDDVELLDGLAADLDVADARAVAGAPRALARRAVRAWLTAEHPPSAATVERVLAVARGDAVGCDVGRGWRVVRHAQRLKLLAPNGEQARRVV